MPFLAAILLRSAASALLTVVEQTMHTQHRPPPGVRHLEVPDRLIAAREALSDTNAVAHWRKAGEAVTHEEAKLAVERVHTAGHLQEVQRMSQLPENREDGPWYLKLRYPSTSASYSLGRAIGWKRERPVVLAHAATHNWYVTYDQLEGNVKPFLREDRSDRVLVLGCGTSELCRRLWGDGWTNVTGVDFSRPAVEHMQAQHARLRLLQAGQERGEHLVLRRVASAVGRREALGEQREVALQRRDVGRQPAHLAR